MTPEPSDKSKGDVIEVVSLAEYARHQAETYHDDNDQAAIAFRHIANCIDRALDASIAETREECAVVADRASERFVQRAERAKAINEKRDFETMAIAAGHVSFDIRALKKEPSHEG